MDLLDIFWNLSQDETLNELATTHATAEAAIQRLQEQNHDLRIQLSVLVHLLTGSGQITAEEFLSATAEARKDVLAARPGGKPIQKPPMYVPLKPKRPKA